MTSKLSSESQLILNVLNYVDKNKTKEIEKSLEFGLDFINNSKSEESQNSMLQSISFINNNKIANGGNITVKDSATVDGRDISGYSDEHSDLGNIEDYEEFLKELKEIYSEVYRVLKPNKRCCCIVMDIRKKSSFLKTLMLVI